MIYYLKIDHNNHMNIMNSYQAKTNLERLVEKFPKNNWDWYCLSTNVNISIEFIITNL